MNDSAFEALASKHRRSILLSLLEGGPVSDDVTGNGSSAVVAPDCQSERQLQVKLHHVHLPKLDDYGFVRWRKDAGEVKRGPAYEEIRPLLEFVDANAER